MRIILIALLVSVCSIAVADDHKEDLPQGSTVNELMDKMLVAEKSCDLNQCYKSCEAAGDSCRASGKNGCDVAQRNCENGCAQRCD
jgi:hypothetical protein